MKHDLEIIPFGDSAGKTFAEVSLNEINRIVMWLERRGLHNSWKYESVYKAAVEYLELNHYGDGTNHEE